MTDRILINQDVFIYDILDKLSIPDLLRFFATNKELKQKLYPYFQEKIDDYAEDLEYRNQVAKPTRVRNIESLQTSADNMRNYPILIIDKVLANFMGITDVFNYRGISLYNSRLLILWWIIYISRVVGHLVKQDDIVPINHEMAQLISRPVGTSMRGGEFLHDLEFFHTGRIGVARSVDEVGIPINMIDEIMFRFAVEYRELLTIYILLTQQNVKEGTLPGGFSNLAQYSDII